MSILAIGISGVSGRIGQRLVNLILDDKETKISSGTVSKQSPFRGQDIGSIINIKDIGVRATKKYKHADIWIDFSTPKALDKALMHCLATKTALVSGTTGLDKNQFKALKNAGKHIPILWASNFSISINLIQEMLSKYKKLGVNSEIEIEEVHHIHKLDAPSGTAISLAESCEVANEMKRISDLKYSYGKVQITSKRENEVAGDHTVEIDNNSEFICIKHSAKTPKIFALGAFNVAKWLVQQKPGHYSMKDFLESLD